MVFDFLIFGLSQTFKDLSLSSVARMLLVKFECLQVVSGIVNVKFQGIIKVFALNVARLCSKIALAD